jgi:hypothetical protein
MKIWYRIIVARTEYIRLHVSIKFNTFFFVLFCFVLIFRAAASRASGVVRFARLGVES